MNYVRVTSRDELPAGSVMLVEAEGKEILLANVEGEYFAIANKCTHMGGSLAKGHIVGNIIQCPRHGAQFDVKSGKLVSGPKIGFLKLKVNDEPSYSVKIEGNDILVGIQE